MAIPARDKELDAQAEVDERIKLISNAMHHGIPETETSTLASDIRAQEKVMAGLIEKAKRTGLDHRLIAMANTDFERGFMALDKALTTNKG